MIQLFAELKNEARPTNIAPVEGAECQRSPSSGHSHDTIVESTAGSTAGGVRSDERTSRDRMRRGTPRVLIAAAVHHLRTSKTFRRFYPVLCGSPQPARSPSGSPQRSRRKKHRGSSARSAQALHRKEKGRHANDRRTSEAVRFPILRIPGR